MPRAPAGGAEARLWSPKTGNAARQLFLPAGGESGVEAEPAAAVVAPVTEAVARTAGPARPAVPRCLRQAGP
eukprot:5176322-Lingulodinium_polyedra.AAC.1